MWIRSQDCKTLVNASEVRIVSSYKVFGIYSGIDVLGYYSTEENALKVMDMIEEAIIKHESMTNNENEFFDERKILFKMPKDSVLNVEE